MNFSPTSRTLFLVQLGAFFAGIIVVVCNCLYLSAYPKSPEPEGVSAIACATLAFALFSTIMTLVLLLRQKSGRTINTVIEGCWVGAAILLWILAAAGGIAKPANNMTNVSCKVLPTGKDTDDKNYIRACQSMFASTAFCIVSALFFIAIAGLLITFSIQKAVRDKKAAQVKVGGTYQLGPSPSMHRRAEQAKETSTEEPKDEEAGSSTTAPIQSTPGTTIMTPATTSVTHGGTFSENVYQDPFLTAPTPAPGIAVLSPPPAAMVPHTAAGTPSPYNTLPPSGENGHVPQGSYQSANGGYDYNTVASNNAYNNNTTHSNNGGGYFGPVTGGHAQQASAMSNMSASAYDQYSPYASTGNMFPPQSQQQQPPSVQQQQQQQQQMAYPPQTMPQGSFPMMGPPHSQSPYGTQYMHQQHQQQQQHQSVPMPQGQQTPVMEMPRPEYF
ncbi:hypothetical protein BG011_001741 [Mortierella polycephala]|uniref:MARVEL domain-containing protein n=1 Tax=Mortierella polycephala TaxID=41804 RepID=A0A9P6Q844_9FUNG|nr:hypothetical protein BG011_001741 [Mortierella polycephala]